MKVIKYTVQNGDNEFKIAQKFHTSVGMTRDLNKIQQGNYVKPGHIIKVVDNRD